MPCFSNYFSSRWLCVWLLLGLNLATPVQQALAQSGPRLLLNVPGARGSSVFSGFTGWIEIADYEWGMFNSPSFGHVGQPNTNKPSFNEITLHKTRDLSSSNLLSYCTQGTVLTNITLVGAVAVPFTGKSATYFRLELRSGFVSSVSVDLRASDEAMVETVVLGFDRQIVWTYSLFDTNAAAGTPLKFSSSSSVTYDKVQKRGATLVPFKATGQSGTGVTRIVWPSAPFAVYDIFRAANPVGPFTLYTTVTNAAATNLTLNVTNNSGTTFFYTVQGQF